MATEMNFTSTCKFCGKVGLGWKHVQQPDGMSKWTLFDNAKQSHTCGVSKEPKTKAYKKLKKHKTLKEAVAAMDEDNDKIKKKVKKLKKKKKVVFDSLTNLKDGNFITGVDMGKAEEELDKQASKVLKKMNTSMNDVAELIKVKLLHASKLYQAVYASSKGSVYYVVAMFEGLNMAARINVYTGYYEVSIRIEGFKLPIMKNLDNLSKFNLSDDGEYASVHFKCDTRIECNAIIFAYMGMIGRPFLTAVPDLNKLIK